MRSIGSLLLVVLVAAAHWPAAPFGAAARTNSSVAAAMSCCGTKSCCPRRHVCAPGEACAAAQVEVAGADHASVPGRPGWAALCAGRCSSDPVRVVQGDPDPWMLQAAVLAVGPPFVVDAILAAGAEPAARTPRPSVPPPRA